MRAVKDVPFTFSGRVAKVNSACAFRTRDVKKPARRASSAQLNKVPRPPELTPRQRQVLAMVAEGYSSPQIALHLGISFRTVDQRRAEIARKAGGGNAIAVLRRFYRFVPRRPA